MKRETHTVIKAEPAAVWQVLILPELMSLWLSNVDNLRTRDGGPLAPQQEILFEARGKTCRTVVTRFDKEHAIELESHQGPFTAVYRYQLEPVATGTNLCITIRFHARGLARIIEPLVAHAVWSTERDQGARIAALVSGEINDPAKVCA